MKTRIAIMGYGNLGRGVLCAVKNSEDMELVCIFTRRDPAEVKPLYEGVSVYSADEMEKMKDKIDVLLLCGGSATDLPRQTPACAKLFNVVDSFDTHAKIPEHFEAVDKVCKEHGKIGLISCGWDPGLFSINRVMAASILPHGKDYTFWGKGVSQGHSDAIRRIEGVLDAKQYTVPVEEVLQKVREGSTEEFTTRQKHKRVCYVVAKEGADQAKIEETIVNMPNYFADYDTTVNFISKEELDKNHAGLPHGGVVIRSGKTGKELTTKHTIEYSLNLESNPEFTASVLVAYARAVVRLSREGVTGCKTVLDIAPSYLSPLSDAELRKTML